MQGSIADIRNSLIAIMLGRLKMTVDECISKYNDMCKRIFANRGSRVKVSTSHDKKWYKFPRPELHVQGAFDHTVLEACIEETILASGEATTDARSVLLNNGQHGQDCRVYGCLSPGIYYEFVH